MQQAYLIMSPPIILVSKQTLGAELGKGIQMVNDKKKNQIKQTIKGSWGAKATISQNTISFLKQAKDIQPV